MFHGAGGGNRGVRRGPRGGPNASFDRLGGARAPLRGLVYVGWAAAPGGASAGRYVFCVTFVTWLGLELCHVAWA